MAASSPPDARLFYPATERNRGPILAVLERVLPPAGTVLEIASGSGEHAAFLAPRFPGLVWQPSDPEPACLASIAAWAETARTSNLRPPLALDVTAADWGEAEEIPIAAILCINMIHISPWRAAEGLLAGAGRLLPAGAPLYLYGPFMRQGRHTAPSNAAFDQSLRAENPDWGVRNLETVAEAAAAAGLALDQVVEMPANNLSVVFRRE